MMARVALGDVWDEARAFLTREGGLVMPLAFATLGIAFVLFDLVAPDRPPAGANMVPAGPWMLILVPFMLLVLFGNLAISILVLVPRASVGEACRGALVRLPRVMLTALVAMVALTVVSLALGMVALAATLAGAGAAAQALVTVLLLMVALWLAIRLLPLVPLIAIGNPRGGVAAVIREALALTRGRTMLLAGVLLLYGAVFVLISGALGIALGSLFKLVGLALGDNGLGTTLAMIASAAVWSLLQGAWTVFVAILTRRMLAGR